MMKGDIHPHWQETEDESDVGGDQTTSAPTSESRSPHSIPIAISGVSRRPAALIGCMLVTVIGIFFFQGVERLTGQLSKSIEVHITDDGLQPSVVTIEQGQNIVWINEQSIPHIIQSDELCSSTGECLFTSTIFQGDRSSYSITGDLSPGTYSYFSGTSQDIAGKIIVAGTSQGATTQLAEPPREEVIPDIEIAKLTDVQENSPSELNLSDEETIDTTNDKLAPNTNPNPNPNPAPASIPRNPYTVESGRMHPYALNGGPGVEVDGGLHGVAPQYTVPPTQPVTGAGIWLVSLLSVAVFFWMTRQYFRKEY